MRKNIQKRVIDITDIELMPGEPTVCLATKNKALHVAVTNATIICVVFPNLIQKAKKKILLRNGL